jgi:hypothetical protein
MNHASFSRRAGQSGMVGSLLWLASVLPPAVGLPPAFPDQVYLLLPAAALLLMLPALVTPLLALGQNGWSRPAGSLLALCGVAIIVLDWTAELNPFLSTIPWRVFITGFYLIGVGLLLNGLGALQTILDNSGPAAIISGVLVLTFGYTLDYGVTSFLWIIITGVLLGAAFFWLSFNLYTGGEAA